MVRNEPQYHCIKFAYDSNICKTYFLNHAEYCLLEMLSLEPSKLAHLAERASSALSLTSAMVNSAINTLIEADIITNQTSRSKEYRNLTSPPQGSDSIHVIGDIPVMSFPSEVDICITRRCQLKCIHCNINANTRLKDELVPEDWTNIFEQLERYATLKVTISGGEPFVYPHFHAIIQDLTNKNFLKILLTNGVSLKDDLAKKLADANFHVVLSLDGGTACTHDKFRGKTGVFPAVLNALDLLHKRQVSTQITTVLHKQNVSEIEDIIGICLKYGVVRVTFTLLDEIGRGHHANDWMISEEEYLMAKRNIERAQEQFTGIIDIFIEDPKMHIATEAPGLYCKAGTYGFAIDCDGTVYPCNLCYQLEYHPIGNAKMKNLWELWRDPKWGFFRGNIELKHLIDCSACPLASRCALKACRARSYLRGNVYGKPYGCPREKRFGIETKLATSHNSG